jgi:hypothetical protein
MNQTDERLRNALRNRAAVSTDRLPDVLMAGRSRRRRKTASAAAGGVVASVVLIGALGVGASRLGEGGVREEVATGTETNPSEPIGSSVTTPPTTGPSSSAGPSTEVPPTVSATATAELRADAVTIFDDESLRFWSDSHASVLPAPCDAGTCSIADATRRGVEFFVSVNPEGEEPPTAENPSVIRQFQQSDATWPTTFTADVGVSLGSIAVDGAGALWVVAYPADGPSTLLRIADGIVTEQDEFATTVVTSDDGALLAYGVADPRANVSEFVVRDLVNGTERRIAPSPDRAWPSFYFPEPMEWSDDGTVLLVRTAFEGIDYGYLRPFEATSQADAVMLSGDPAEGEPQPAEAACFVGASRVLVARWAHAYADGADIPGGLEVVDTKTGAVVDTYAGSPVLGRWMACRSGGWAVVVTDTGREIEARPDGTQTDLSSNARVVLTP